MRMQLSGLAHRLLEPHTIVWTKTTTFYPDRFIDLGYTDFTVLCIGGAGGQGGGYGGSTTDDDTASGGGGGGGGSHVAEGLLADLPTATAVVVGLAGADGLTIDYDYGTPSTDGSPGGASTFNGTLCQAGGGAGGARATSNTVRGLGGMGGLGDTTAPGTNNQLDGRWNGIIGGGGRGGAGGLDPASGTSTFAGYGEVGAGGTAKLIGAPGGPREDYIPFPDTYAEVFPNLKPGPGGGANVGYITHAEAKYYGSGGNGAVAIRLS